jgi:hypothetical protein
MRQADLIRLVHILGMLGSDHAGERASAALAAHRLVTAANSNWWELLSPAKMPPGAPRGGRRYWVDISHDPVTAAQSRMRQLKRENEELLEEVKRLKRWLDARRAPLRRPLRRV